ncbi:unnamed protein product [Anisakis simplex]|uniref:Uncharacterized protein n=1 Tax=Anisakis simplex TaxID=6269 RepID=A0A3P6QQK0_ANISI|nr:unnamed protein product [Anisakis simplex]
MTLPTIDQLPQIVLRGHSLPKQRIAVSPLTDRRRKLANLVECGDFEVNKKRTDKSFDKNAYLGRTGELYDELIIDWDQIFFSNHFRLYSEFLEEFNRQIQRITYITQNHWPLDISELLLSCSEKWTKFLLQQPKLTNFLNSVASLQFASIPKLRVCVTEELLDNGLNIATLFVTPISHSFSDEIRKIGDKIPHAETKLYPKLFPYTKYVTVKDFGTEYKTIAVKSPLALFKFEMKRMNEITNDIEQYTSKDYELERWKKLIEDLDQLNEDVLRKQLFHRQKQFLFDFSQFQNVFIGRLKAQRMILYDVARSFLVDAANSLKVSDLMLWLNSSIERLFLLSTSKLRNKSQNEQILLISDAINTDIPQIKQLMDTMHQTLFYVMDYFVIKGQNHFIQLLYVSAKDVTFYMCTCYLLKVTEQSNKMTLEGETIQKEFDVVQNKYRSSNTISDLKRVSLKLNELHTECSKLSTEYPVIKNQLQLFDLEPIKCDIPALLHELTLFKRFSELHSQIAVCEEKWLTCNPHINEFNNLGVPKIIENLKAEFKDLQKTLDKERDESLFDILNEMRTADTTDNKPLQIKELIEMNLIANMKKIEEILNEMRTADTTDNKPLQIKELIEMNLIANMKKIEEVSAVANKELMLEDNVKLMKEQWTNVALTFAKYKDTVSGCILLQEFELVVMPDQLRLLLETHIIRTQTILASPFVTPLTNFVREWADVLELIDEFFSLYFKKALYAKVAETSNIAIITIFRLFFLSNNELMDLLSRARNINTAASFLPKLFSSIRAFEFTNRGEVCALLSGTERLKLLKPVSVVLAKRHVEKWLTDVEKEMRKTVKALIKKVVDEHSLNLVPLSELIQEQPSQIVLLYYKLSTTDAIQKTLDENRSFQELRYYWRNENLMVEMLNFSTQYEYEFISAFDLTIITRHVKKILAERFAYGGLLSGPAATGKSHTVKHLSKSLGRFFSMFNCSTEIRVKQLVSLIKGCVLSGSTLCFDEFNRLTTHGLSATISTVLSIQKAVITGQNRLRLHDNEYSVNTASAIHVTMNSNSIERRSLPANVDSAFRRVEVNASDSEQIAVILLQMSKLEQSKTIARIIISLLSMCSLLIGPRIHLDFELRALKVICNACTMDENRDVGGDTASKLAARSALRVIAPALSPIVRFL